jgi:beta-xylosidase
MKIRSIIAILLAIFCATICHADNPIIKDAYTADPAAMVYKDTVYLYTGHDVAGSGLYNMNDWRCYSSTDMKNWTSYGSILSTKDFKWSTGDAWASQCIEKNGKFYWYVATHHDNTHPGFAIGVAVGNSPVGPFKDARGTALVTDDMTPHEVDVWEDIDPTVITDTDGTSYLFWGHGTCYWAKLKPNMIELDGSVQRFYLPAYTEGPYIHKHGNLYYLSYAGCVGKYLAGPAEKILYATAPTVTGPWTYRGVITEAAHNSFTIQDSIIEFKGQSYLFYHNGDLPGGGSFKRSVCVERLEYNPDGSIKPITQTKEGVDAAP